MEAWSLEQAISMSRGIADPRDGRGSREVLVSFVWLDTLAHHWPSKMTPELLKLREKFSFLKITETGRYLKQRRLILRRLASEA